MIAMLLKSLGIKASEQDIKNLEVLIPQIPGKAVEIISQVNAACRNFDERLHALETRQNYIILLLEKQYGTGEPAPSTLSRELPTGNVDTNGSDRR
jgi:hypothetical protein